MSISTILCQNYLTAAKFCFASLALAKMTEVQEVPQS